MFGVIIFVILFLSFLLAFLSMKDFRPLLFKLPRELVRVVEKNGGKLFGVIVFTKNKIYHFHGRESFLEKKDSDSS